MRPSRSPAPPTTTPAPELPPVRRVTADGPLILSVHIPKTAGSRFSTILRRQYGPAFATYYGANDRRTHPLVCVPPRQLTAAHLQNLRDSGVRVLHGHMKAGPLLDAVGDPSCFWLWLREPVEQAISHYHYLRRLESESNPLIRAARDEATDLAAFAALPRTVDFQARYAGDLPLERAGFVGVTELFAPLLPLLGLRDARLRGNVNRAKPLVDLATRRAIAEHRRRDFALYSHAMEIALRRLGVRDTQAGPLYSAADAVRQWLGRTTGARP